MIIETAFIKATCHVKFKLWVDQGSNNWRSFAYRTNFEAYSNQSFVEEKYRQNRPQHVKPYNSLHRSYRWDHNWIRRTERRQWKLKNPPDENCWYYFGWIEIKFSVAPWSIELN